MIHVKRYLSIVLPFLLVNCVTNAETEDSDSDADDAAVGSEDDHPDEGSSDTPDDGTHPRASVLDDMSDCVWVAESSGGNVVDAECSGTQKPLMGHCRGDNKILRSHPFENGSSVDNPEDDEFWYALDGVTGWSCHFGTDVFTTNYAYALCCGS